jgi:hypothetical protein
VRAVIDAHEDEPVRQGVSNSGCRYFDDRKLLPAFDVLRILA